MSLINLSSIISHIKNIKTINNSNVVEIINNNIKKLNNENFELFMHDYIMLRDIYNFKNFNIYDNVIIFPLSNIDKNMQLLHCILIIIDTNYLNLNHACRINLIHNINNNFINYAKNQGYNIYIIKSFDEVEIYNNNYERNIIVVKYDEYYFPVDNLNTGYYKNDCNLINFLKEINYKIEDELITDDNYEFIELHESDNISNDVKPFIDEIKISDRVNLNTKLKLKDKNNIFIKIDESDKIDNTTFIKSMVIDNEELLKRTKLTLSLAELQNIALQLNISIVNGLTKQKTPKNKTKLELYNNIVELLKK